MHGRGLAGACLELARGSRVMFLASLHVDVVLQVTWVNWACKGEWVAQEVGAVGS